MKTLTVVSLATLVRTPTDAQDLPGNTTIEFPTGYYVYTISVSDVVRYVGKGKGLRLYSHMNRGAKPIETRFQAREHRIVLTAQPHRSGHLRGNGDRENPCRQLDRESRVRTRVRAHASIRSGRQSRTALERDPPDHLLTTGTTGLQRTPRAQFEPQKLDGSFLICQHLGRSGWKALARHLSMLRGGRGEGASMSPVWLATTVGQVVEAELAANHFASSA